MSTKELSQQVAFSPLPRKQEEASEKNQEVYGFCEALNLLRGGKKITRKEWKNADFYGVLSPKGLVMLHKPDGKLYYFIFSEGDMDGEDWVTLN